MRGRTGVQDKHYDRWTHLPEKRRVLQKWARFMKKVIAGSERVVSNAVEASKDTPMPTVRASTDVASAGSPGATSPPVGEREVNVTAHRTSETAIRASLNYPGSFVVAPIRWVYRKRPTGYWARLGG